MRSFTHIAKGLLVSAVAVGASFGLAGCGPDYAIFAITVSSATPRNDIAECRMTITADNGDKVLDGWVLHQVAGNPDEPLKQGCASELTPAKVGVFSYSTSRSSGSLTFKVNAYSDTAPYDPSNDKPVESATATTAIKKYPPEIPVELPMARTGNSGDAEPASAGLVPRRAAALQAPPFFVAVSSKTMTFGSANQPGRKAHDSGAGRANDAHGPMSTYTHRQVSRQPKLKDGRRSDDPDVVWR